MELFSLLRALLGMYLTESEADGSPKERHVLNRPDGETFPVQVVGSLFHHVRNLGFCTFMLKNDTMLPMLSFLISGFPCTVELLTLQQSITKVR